MLSVDSPDLQLSSFLDLSDNIVVVRTTYVLFSDGHELLVGSVVYDHWCLLLRRVVQDIAEGENRVRFHNLLNSTCADELGLSLLLFWLMGCQKAA